MRRFYPIFGAALLAACGSFADTPLNVPIRFEDGFTLERQFQTNRAKKYWLIVAFHKQTHMSSKFVLTGGSPPDEFTAKFRITCKGATIAEGQNDPADPRRPATLSRDYTERLLTLFDARPGESYDLWFHVVHAGAGVRSTGPVVIVREKTYPPGE